MKKILFIFSMAILGVSGCVSFQNHEHARGSVVALDSSTEGHVCMSSSEVKQGEQLSLFQSICTTNERKAGRYTKATEQTTCIKVSKGAAEVIENSDPHFIKIKAMMGFTLETGFIVEKLLR